MTGCDLNIHYYSVHVEIWHPLFGDGSTLRISQSDAPDPLWLGI